jgi:hypothetical protein
MVIVGVLIFFEVSSNSRSRGIPSVTFLSETPAKWKVFKVICVVGSPILWAATEPTAYPAGARACLNFDFISERRRFN